MDAVLLTHRHSVAMLTASRRAPQAGRHVAVVVWCRCGMAQQAEAPPQRMAGRGDGSRDSSSTDARRATDRDDAKRRPRVPRACQAGDECPWLLDGHRGCRWRKRLLAGTPSTHSSDRLGRPEAARRLQTQTSARASPSAISSSMRLAIGVVPSRPSQPDVNPCSNHPSGDAL
ncbi:hypothetical protein COCC4DRAFT_126952 [Bipolaris maydis ATCC 48331]|uniref:Uncharacterized protein n=2 Tax=Cochliobolus heterostrophus TaxID=5016 RepID=M2TVC0_COCH5|nr:uncharacterized protein COCC4DRAFT_126952 [Bipolaris maydis ATCC 48331]EMD90484.1 hypothetical protein COCHEDRAFT_1157491 [Bipolaris maydis C5]ENI09304.1 hypothetical protein COCC4DRAFT_126952 [Bipolaris maydis ATCC 48331]